MVASAPNGALAIRTGPPIRAMSTAGASGEPWKKRTRDVAGRRSGVVVHQDGRVDLGEHVARDDRVVRSGGEHHVGVDDVRTGVRSSGGRDLHVVGAAGHRKVVGDRPERHVGEGHAAVDDDIDVRRVRRVVDDAQPRHASRIRRGVVDGEQRIERRCGVRRRGKSQSEKREGDKSACGLHFHLPAAGRLTREAASRHDRLDSRGTSPAVSFSGNLPRLICFTRVEESWMSCRGRNLADAAAGGGRGKPRKTASRPAT